MDKTTINNVVSYLHESLVANGLENNRIALFGSALTGNMHPDSDIDMIVVSKNFENKDIFERINMTLKAQLDVQRKYVVPMDILLKTPEEYEYSKSTYFDSTIVL
ncbi:MAG: nucleotidyltransferase domain-containing protein [Prevotellaceae bacterium]|jgi:predicted nucleotidyltransferase|nr:nucleotidyltransferase domain-containing protein [Prevotellaceae bacterium]